jgi:hypothetical protein
MSDFPPTAVSFPEAVVVSPMSMHAVFDHVNVACGLTAAGSGAWPNVSQALGYWFVVYRPMVVKRMVVQVTTQSGNLDMGIYDEKGNCVVSKGSTAVAVAGVQSVDLTASISGGTASPVIGPGCYIAALSVDNITAAFQRYAFDFRAMRISGVVSKTSTFPLATTSIAFGGTGTAYLPHLCVKGVTNV